MLDLCCFKGFGIYFEGFVRFMKELWDWIGVWFFCGYEDIKIGIRMVYRI